MPRRFFAQRLVIASHNPGKCAELEHMLHGQAAELVRASALAVPVPEETADSFVGNAAQKALFCARFTGLPSLADDCGLCIDALGGAPGVLSARWGGEKREFPVAISRLWQALPKDAERSASFHCGLALAWPDGHVETAEGVIRGSVTFPPVGSLGNGYDPIFIPAGASQTFGQLDPQQRSAVNHRAAAWKILRAQCFSDPEKAPDR